MYKLNNFKSQLFLLKYQPASCKVRCFHKRNNEKQKKIHLSLVPNNLYLLLLAKKSSEENPFDPDTYLLAPVLWVYLFFHSLGVSRFL